MAQIVRKYYRNVHYTLDETTNTLKLLPEFHERLLTKKLPGNKGFKKVGGSSVAGFLVPDRYKTPFAAFCNIANLGLPVLDEKYVNAGRIIEPKVIAAITAKIHKKITTYPAEKYNYDYFSDKDPVIGGVPDGFIKETNTIIEIKTTNIKNYETWLRDGTPMNYRKQAAQYAYLMKAPRYAIVAAFLHNEDYEDPSAVDLQKRRIRNWNYELNETEARHDIALIKTIYEKWTTTGLSPQYSLSDDTDLIEWLRCSNETEWEALKNRWIASKKYKP